MAVLKTRLLLFWIYETVFFIQLFQNSFSCWPVVVRRLVELAFLAYKPPAAWAENELRLITSLSLSTLPPLPLDPSNRASADPVAQELGHALFFDARLSANGQVSCASCHQPELRFTDGLTKRKPLVNHAEIHRAL